MSWHQGILTGLRAVHRPGASDLRIGRQHDMSKTPITPVGEGLFSVSSADPESPERRLALAAQLLITI